MTRSCVWKSPSLARLDMRLDEQLLQELESCHMNAISMLRSRRELLDRMIEEIVERGILNEDDIEKLARECKTELGKFEPHACV